MIREKQLIAQEKKRLERINNKSVPPKNNGKISKQR